MSFLHARFGDVLRVEPLLVEALRTTVTFESPNPGVNGTVVVPVLDLAKRLVAHVTLVTNPSMFVHVVSETLGIFIPSSALFTIIGTRPSVCLHVLAQGRCRGESSAALGAGIRDTRYFVLILGAIFALQTQVHTSQVHTSLASS